MKPLKMGYFQGPTVYLPEGNINGYYMVNDLESYGLSMIIWLVVEPTPLKNMKVSWDDDITNINGKIIQMVQTTNQANVFELSQEKLDELCHSFQHANMMGFLHIFPQTCSGNFLFSC